MFPVDGRRLDISSCNYRSTNNEMIRGVNYVGSINSRFDIPILQFVIRETEPTGPSHQGSALFCSNLPISNPLLPAVCGLVTDTR